MTILPEGSSPRRGNSPVAAPSPDPFMVRARAGTAGSARPSGNITRLDVGECLLFETLL